MYSVSMVNGGVMPLRHLKHVPPQRQSIANCG